MTNFQKFNKKVNGRGLRKSQTNSKMSATTKDIKKIIIVLELQMKPINRSKIVLLSSVHGYKVNDALKFLKRLNIITKIPTQKGTTLFKIKKIIYNKI